MLRRNITTSPVQYSKCTKQNEEKKCIKKKLSLVVGISFPPVRTQGHARLGARAAPQQVKRKRNEQQDKKEKQAFSHQVLKVGSSVSSLSCLPVALPAHPIASHDTTIHACPARRRHRPKGFLLFFFPYHKNCDKRRYCSLPSAHVVCWVVVIAGLTRRCDCLSLAEWGQVFVLSACSELKTTDSHPPIVDWLHTHMSHGLLNLVLCGCVCLHPALRQGEGSNQPPSIVLLFPYSPPVPISDFPSNSAPSSLLPYFLFFTHTDTHNTYPHSSTHIQSIQRTCIKEPSFFSF